MSAPPTQPHEHGSASAAREAADSQLPIDQFLPRYDLAVLSLSHSDTADVLLDHGGE